MKKLAFVIFLVSFTLGTLVYLSRKKEFSEYKLETKAAGIVDYKLSVNLSKAREFENLPGIGPSLAEKIIDYREKHGGFKQVSDLKKVRGIGAEKFKKIEPYLTIEIY